MSRDDVARVKVVSRGTRKLRASRSLDYRPKLMTDISESMLARGASVVDRYVVQAPIAKIRQYLEIDRHRVYRVLKDDLGDFDLFIKAVSRLL